MNRAVVKLMDGRDIRGAIQFFNVNKSVFPIVVEKEQGKEEVLSISFDDIKAVYFLKMNVGFVKSEGPHVHMETIDQTVFAGSISTKLLVEFKDGEILHGTTLKYNPSDKGFFLIPLNPGEDSERIYINTRAVKRIERTKMLGRILVEQEKITSDQLDRALTLQKEHREKKIGTILIENDIINEKQLHESLQRQKTNNKMLGEILIEAGYITEEQLGVALKVQQGNRKKRLGEILVDLNYVTPNDICIALSSQLKFPWMDLSKETIPADIAMTFPEETVRRLEAVPVGIKGSRTLIVATANPSVPGLVQELSRVTPLIIEFVIVYDGYLNAAINKIFPPKDPEAGGPASGGGPPPDTGLPEENPPAGAPPGK